MADDVKDNKGTTGATSMTGGDWKAASGQDGGREDLALGGRSGGAAEEDLGPIGMESAGGGSSGGRDEDAGGNGSLGATYNDAGRLVGADSPAGDKADLDSQSGEGQGDDLANRIGGGEGRGTGMSGGGHSGDMTPGRSETDDSAYDLDDRAGYGGPDAGSPGGMGGVRARGGTGNGNPPGGVSPIQADKNRH